MKLPYNLSVSSDFLRSYSICEIPFYKGSIEKDNRLSSDMNKLQLMVNKPTIKIKAKNFKLALYAHVLSLISATLLGLFALLRLVDNFAVALVQIIVALIIVAIELLYIDVDILNQGIVRGLIYIILVLLVFGIRGFGIGSIMALILVIAAVLDIVHDLN